MNALRFTNARAVGGLLVLFVSVLAFLAVRADGFTGVDLELNDGSAWLVDQSEATTGRVNGAVREVEVRMRVVESGDDYLVVQAPGVLLVHNRTAQSLTPIEAASLSVGGSFTLPDSVDVSVGAGTVLLHRPLDGAVWVLSASGSSIGSLDPEIPDFTLGSGGLAAVGHEGSVHLWSESGELTVIRRGGDQSTQNIEGNFTSISAAAENTVLLDEATGRLEVLGSLETSFQVAAGLDLLLQQPSSSDQVVSVASEDGRLWVAPLRGASDSDSELEPVTSGNGGGLLEPVIVGNCVFSVTTEQMRFIRTCGSGVDTMALDGISSGTRIRLFASNERVWIDALDSERAVYLPEEGDPEEIESWGSALFLGDDSEGEADSNLGSNLVRGDSGAESAALGEGDVNQDNGGFEGGDNQPPRARPDEVSARSGRSRVVQVLANDSDPNGDLLIVSEVESISAEQGVVVVSPDRRTVQYTPAGGFAGVVNFSYEVSDGNGGVDRATVEITVVNDETNTAPEPRDDTAVARAGREVSIPVLLNDDDPEGDPLQLVSVTEGPGAISIDERLGIINFTPDSDFSGQAVFEYTVRDDRLLEGTATVTVDVVSADGRNQRPVAEPDLYVAATDTQLTLSVLDNDTDLEGDRLLITEFTTVAGDIDLQPNLETGEVEFPTDEPGTYLFTYVVEDANGPAETLGLVRVEITQQLGNLPPVAVADDPPEFPGIEAGTTRNFNVLANDADPNGDPLVVVAVTPIDERFPLLGLVESADGNFLFEPSSELVGEEVTFQYTITDGFELSSATVTVQVIEPPSIDEPPVAEDDVATVRAGQSILIDVLANDRDPENLPLEIAEGSFDENPAEGITVIQEGNRLRVVASSEVVDPVEFTYSAIDAAEQTDSAFVRVVILAAEIPNQPPEARNIDTTTFESEAVLIAALDSATDPDGDSLSIADVTGAQNGIVEIVGQTGGQAVVRYTPDQGFVGTDSFTYIVADPDNAQDAAQIRVVVQEPPIENNAPNAVDDLGFSVREGRSITIPVLLNDRDIDGDELSVVRVGEPSLGTAVIEGNQITFTAPTELLAGAEIVSLQYWISDGNAIIEGRDDSYTAAVSIEVVPPEPEPPTPAPDVFGPFREGEAVVLDVLANDSDPDGNREDLTIVAVNGNAAVSISADGRSIALDTPDAPFSFTYTVSDSDQEVATAAVSVSVTPNRPPVAGVDVAEVRQQETVELEVLVNDADEDGDPISLLAISDFRGGFAEIIDLGTGLIRFTPDDGVTQGGFSYRISDGPGGHEVTGAAQITVLPPANTPPTAAPGTFEVPAGETQVFNVLNLVDDTETPNDLSVTVTGGSGDIVVTNLGNGSISIETDIEGRGATATLEYTVSDSGPNDPLSAESTIEISVIETRRPLPQAIADGPFETDQGETLTMADLVGNDLPTDQALNIVSVRALGAGGTVSVTGDGQGVTYEPQADFFGTFNFTYVIEDETRQADRQATSGAVSVRVIGRPEAPATLGSEPSNGQVALSWPTPNNNGGPITAYEIQLNDGEIRDVGVGNTFVWDELANGQLYTFRVRAVNQAGPSDNWSQDSSAQPEALPDQPAPPVGIPGDQSIDLSWSAPDSAGSEIIAYELDLVGGPTVGLTDTTNLTEGLTNGTSYQFRVRARTRASENDGWGEWSNLSPQLVPFGLPGAPGGLACTGEIEAVFVTWNAADNNGAAISGYQVTLVQTGEVRNANTGTSFTWNGLQNGFTGDFEVRAVNQAGVGEAVGVATCTTPDRPDVPGNVSASANPQEATVSWNAPNDNNAAITTYRVTSNNGLERTTSATSVTFSGLTNGTGYSFRVEALNAVGWSDLSAQSNAVTPIDVPGAPSAVSATNQDDSESTVTWTGPGNNGGSTITSYNVRLNTGATRTGNSAFTWTGLSNGTSYSFTVQACNAAGCGAFSTASNTVVPVGIPTVVRNLSCTDSQDPAQCSWQSPATGTAQLVRYEYEVGNGGLITDDTRTNLTLLSLSQVDPGDSGVFRIRACSVVGCGPFTQANYSVAPIIGTVSIGQGTAATGNSCHNSASIIAAGGDPDQGCYNIRVTIAGWDGPQTVRCHGATNPAGRYEEFGTLTLSNGTHQVCPYSQAGRNVLVVVGGFSAEGLPSGAAGNQYIVPSPSMASLVFGPWTTN